MHTNSSSEFDAAILEVIFIMSISLNLTSRRNTFGMVTNEEFKVS